MFKNCIRTYSTLICISQTKYLTNTNKIKFLQKPNYSKQFSTTLTKKNVINENYKVYSGPLSGTAKKLKVFSMASLIITIMISPIIMIVDAPMGLGARTFLLVTTLSTSAVSTGLIHLCLSPYVRNIYHKPSTLKNPSTSESSSAQITPESFLTIETLTLFCRSNFTTLPVKSLEPSFRFFTTWKVNKIYENEIKAMTRKGKQLKPKEFFYIHNELCENKVMREVINKLGNY